MVNEIEQTEPEKEKPQNSRDYKEITIVITILAGISAFLLKLIDYFNNNIITISDHVQFIIYLIVFLSLIEISLIVSFLLLKGIILSTISENELSKNLAQGIFIDIFLVPIPIIIMLISMLFFYEYFIEVHNIIITVLYWVITIFVAFGTIIYLAFWKDFTSLLRNNSDDKIQSGLLETLKNFNYSSLIHYNIILIVILVIVFVVSSTFILPSYLLVGHYSIEVFPESNHDADMLTFTIEETGINYARCFITLYKLNLGNNSLENIDNITIPAQNESKNKLMFGGIHGLYYYVNVNTSTLAPGNYILHAEVTNDPSKESNFGTIKKQDDKLFYIAPKNTNVSS